MIITDRVWVGIMFGVIIGVMVVMFYNFLARF